jgi:N-sulfoglucosamine sulfohydrolase
MSRSVFDGRYIYIRHFMPQMPYFQDAIIFKKEGSYEEIHRLKKSGGLPPGTAQMFQRKPIEQLFDLENDPFEQTNLINEKGLEDVVANLQGKLNLWMLKHRDTGLFNEGEMMQRAFDKQTSVYKMARNYSDEDFSKIIQAAQKVGKVENADELIPFLEDADSAVRFWGLVALDAFEGDITDVNDLLTSLLDDKSNSVVIKAAEIKIKKANDKKALETLGKMLKLDFEPMVLQAAISTRLIGEKACPLIPEIQKDIMPKYSGDIWGRYKSWSYSMFIGMALDQTQMNCGYEIEVQR